MKHPYTEYESSKLWEIVKSSIISVLERLKEIIEKKNLETKSSQLVLDLKQELNNYVGR